MADFDNLFAYSGEIIWYIAFLILIPIGIAFTIKYKALQVTNLPDNIDAAVGKDAREENEKGISSYQAFLIALGERVGVGNIVSVAAAIMVGGPGAIFWMWVFAIVVAIISFAETVVSQIYKDKNDDGMYIGGPAFNARKGFGSERAGRGLSYLYMAMILILAFTVTSLFIGQYELVGLGGNPRMEGAIIFTIVLVIVLFGGMKFIAKASSYIVPIMAILWIALCIAVMIANWNNLGNAFGMIFHYAFVIPEGITEHGFLSVEGLWEGIKGPVGALLGTVMIVGLRRGIFSNDAGIGTVSIISSAANAKHPIEQGLVQSLAVLIDTIVICTCTALVILSFGSWSDILGLNLDYAPLVTEVMSRSLLGDAAKYIITFFLFVFTITTLISLMGMMESTVGYFGNNATKNKVIRAAIIVVCFISCFFSVTMAINLCDIFMALCAIINTSMVYCKRKVIWEAYQDYKRQKSEGVRRPEFHSDALSDQTGVTEWK